MKEVSFMVPPPGDSAVGPGRPGVPGRPGIPGGPGGEGQKTKVEVPEHYKYERIPYVSKTVDPRRQIMNIYFPAPYLHGGSVNGYTAKTAPVFFFVPGGGFRIHGLMDAASDQVGAMALRRGFVLAAPDIRGCADHYVDVDGDIPITLSMDIAEKLKANGISDVIFKIVFNGGHGRGGESEAERKEMLDWSERVLSNA